MVYTNFYQINITLNLVRLNFDVKLQNYHFYISY